MITLWSHLLKAPGWCLLVKSADDWSLQCVSHVCVCSAAVCAGAGSCRTSDSQWVLSVLSVCRELSMETLTPLTHSFHHTLPSHHHHQLSQWPSHWSPVVLMRFRELKFWLETPQSSVPPPGNFSNNLSLQHQHHDTMGHLRWCGKHGVTFIWIFCKRSLKMSK